MLAVLTRMRSTNGSVICVHTKLAPISEVQVEITITNLKNTQDSRHVRSRLPAAKVEIIPSRDNDVASATENKKNISSWVESHTISVTSKRTCLTIGTCPGSVSIGCDPSHPSPQTRTSYSQ
jgi:hypothetical protein